MNSHDRRKSIGVLALGLLAMCFTVGRASAQEFRAKITLSGETRWGSATLPAGSYSLIMDNSHLQGTVLLSNGRTSVILVPDMIEHGDISTQTSLATVVSGQDLVVHSLSIGPLGLILRYRVPKAEQPVVAQLPQPAHRDQMARAK